MMGASVPPAGPSDTAGVLNLLSVLADPARTKEAIAGFEKARADAQAALDASIAARAETIRKHSELADEHAKREASLKAAADDLEGRVRQSSEDIAVRQRDLEQRAKGLENRGEQLSDLAAKMDKRVDQHAKAEQALREREAKLDEREGVLNERDRQAQIYKNHLDLEASKIEKMKADLRARYDVLRQAVGTLPEGSSG